MFSKYKCLFFINKLGIVIFSQKTPLNNYIWLFKSFFQTKKNVENSLKIVLDFIGIFVLFVNKT